MSEGLVSSGSLYTPPRELGSHMGIAPVWGSVLNLEDCRSTRPWLFLSCSNVTPFRFAISVVKMWKTLEHAVLQNISERTTLCNGPHLFYHFQIKRNIPDYNGIYSPLCSLLWHSSGRRKRPKWKLAVFEMSWRGERKQGFPNRSLGLAGIYIDQCFRYLWRGFYGSFPYNAFICKVGSWNKLI